MHNNPQPDYIGSSELCEILGIDRSTLSRWVQSGRIKPAMKLPGLRGAFLFDRPTAARAEVAS
jgi:transcriptional regulator with XRE-family HTH domain